MVNICGFENIDSGTPLSLTGMTLVSQFSERYRRRRRGNFAFANIATTHACAQVSSIRESLQEESDQSVRPQIRS